MKKEIDFFGYTLIISLFIMLVIAAYLSFKSIDYKILEKLEASPLDLTTPKTTQTPSVPPELILK
jgi:hypothetical protein